MNKTYLAGAVLSAGLLVSPLFTQAASLTSNQVQAILGLLASFNADAATIANVQVTLTGGSTVTTMPTQIAPVGSASSSSMMQGRGCHDFQVNLGRGSRSSEVGELSRMFGGGATDVPHATTTFDTDMQTNVMMFQGQNGIPKTGFVGPQTRARLNALYGCHPIAQPSPNLPPMPPIAVPSPNLPPMATSTVRIGSLGPNSGTIGTTVTITGKGFTATGNKLRFGMLNTESNPAYSLSSADGSTLTFTVPEGNYMACWDAKPRCMTPMMVIGAGTYMVSIVNANGVSNQVPFTVGSSTTLSGQVTN